MFNLKEILEATGGRLENHGQSKRWVGVSIDTRTIKPKEVFVAIVGKKFDGHDFIPQAIAQGASAVVYSQTAKVGRFNKDCAYIRVTDTTAALGDIAAYYRRRFKIPVIAVTGSSGKTTTKEMISWILSARYHVLKNEGTQNNYYGVPLTLLKIHDKHDICVIEMGTNRVGEIKRLTQIASPTVGIITNIGPAHLEFLGNLKGVYREKIDLLKHLMSPQIAFLNQSDIFLAKLSRIRSKPYFFYGINTHGDLRAKDIVYKPGGISFMLNDQYPFEIKHSALHNVSNSLAAIGCALIFGLDMPTIQERVAAFDSPDMRLKEIKLRHGVVFDDSYNSNPQSLKQAIDVLCRHMSVGRRILVMGDMLELGDDAENFHSYFGRYVARKNIDMLITMGPLSRKACDSARKSGMGPDCVFCFDDNQQVIEFLTVNLRDGDTLLVKGSRSMRMEQIVAALKERM